MQTSVRSECDNQAGRSSFAEDLSQKFWDGWSVQCRMSSRGQDQERESPPGHGHGDDRHRKTTTERRCERRWPSAVDGVRFRSPASNAWGVPSRAGATPRVQARPRPPESIASTQIIAIQHSRSRKFVASGDAGNHFHETAANAATASPMVAPVISPPHPPTIVPKKGKIELEPLLDGQIGVGVTGSRAVSSWRATVSTPIGMNVRTS